MAANNGIEAVQELLTAKSKATRDIAVFSFGELYNDNSPEEPCLIEPDFLGPGEFLLVAGPPKSQKYLLLSSLFESAVLGRPSFDFTVPRPLKVFYINAEMNRRILRKRFKVAGHKYTPEEIQLLASNFKITDRFRDIRNDDGVNTMAGLCQKEFPDKPPDIIALDPLANLFDGDSENDTVAMTAFLRDRIEQLRQKINPKAAIVLAHHAKKVGPNAIRDDPFDCIRGSTALRGYYQFRNSFHINRP